MARSPRVQIVIDGKDNTKKSFGTVSKNLETLEKKTASIGRAMAASLTGIISIATLKRITDANTEMAKLDRVLRENTESQKAFNSAQQETARIADELGVAIGSVVNDFGGLNGSMSALGYSSKEAIRVTETLSKLMSLEGADPGPTIKRFTRALSKGELHQARFNLMLQDQPALLDLISAATGRTIEELRMLSAAGELTALMLTDSVLEMGDAIDERFSEIPQTVEQAMNRINNNISNAFRDDKLMQPMVDSLNELADVLKDPAAQQGLAALASIMTGTASNVASVTADVGLFNESLNVLGRVVTGDITKIELLAEEIKMIDKVINKTGRAGKFFNFIFGKDSLEKQKADLVARREMIINEETGATAEMRAEEEKRQIMLKEEKEKEAKIQRQYVEDIKEYNKQAVKAVEDRGKELAKAEKEAAKKVADAKKEIAAIEKQFDDIRKEMSGGGNKEPSFAEYQRLATSARKAMASGDTAKVKEDALAAANVLKELESSGENSFGFDGMVNSMEALAKSAAELDQADAQAQLETIRLEMTELAAKGKELENMPVSVELDDESLEEVKAQISTLLEQLKIEAVIPVRVAGGGAPSADPVPGFAEGGWTGPGSKYKFGGFVHADEHVQPKRIVREPGALQFLEEIRRNGFRNTINRIKGYAEGGLVGSNYTPPNINPELLNVGEQKSIGTLQFNLGGADAFSVDVAGSSDMDALHRAALKFGRTRK